MNKNNKDAFKNPYVLIVVALLTSLGFTGGTYLSDSDVELQAQINELKDEINGLESTLLALNQQLRNNDQTLRDIQIELRERTIDRYTSTDAERDFLQRDARIDRLEQRINKLE